MRGSAVTSALEPPEGAVRGSCTGGLADHVLIIGVDGLGAEQLPRGRIENITRLMHDGASTLHARGVFPTDSAPNWASLIMGAPPEIHGVIANNWDPARPIIPPMDTTTRFPTIFGVTRAQCPGAKIGIFHEWPDFARLVEPGVADPMEHGASAQKTIESASAFIRTAHPVLTFVHLDLVDRAGHQSGWNSRNYRRAVRAADTLVGRLLSAVDESGDRDRTLVLLSADHGGIRKGHGGSTLQELEIPWIMQGPGVAHGWTLQSPVSICDTAVTVAAALGLSVPRVWTGRAVVEAFTP